MHPIPLLTLALAACAARPGNLTSFAVAGRLDAELRVARGETPEFVDLDEDGRPDVANIYVEPRSGPRRLVRKVFDLNLDGRVDVVSYFDVSEQLVREEMDGDFDGRFDWVDHYEAGVRRRSEIDTDFDGAPNIRALYAPDGSVELKEWDADGDGTFERRLAGDPG